MNEHLKRDLRNAGDDVVFICGALRSGTTLLRLMIDHHPQLSNPGEMDFLFECPRQDNGQFDLSAYKANLVLNRIFLDKNLSIDETLDHQSLVHSFIKGVTKPGKKLTINIHRHFDQILEIFPNARFVHLLRDPRDVAHSSIGMGWAANVYHGVQHWIDSEQSFERLRRTVPEDRVFSFKNEDLILNPERELTKLCRFLDVAYDDAMLSYPEKSTYSAPDASLVEQWRNKQSNDEVGLVEGRVGSMLTDRGYEPSGVAPVYPNALRKILLRLDNKLGGFRVSAKRYGFFLTILRILSDRLRIEPLRGYVYSRINERAVKYLK